MVNIKSISAAKSKLGVLEAHVWDQLKSATRLIDKYQKEILQELKKKGLSHSINWTPSFNEEPDYYILMQCKKAIDRALEVIHVANIDNSSLLEVRQTLEKLAGYLEKSSLSKMNALGYILIGICITLAAISILGLVGAVVLSVTTIGFSANMSLLSGWVGVKGATLESKEGTLSRQIKRINSELGKLEKLKLKLDQLEQSYEDKQSVRPPSQ